MFAVFLCCLVRNKLIDWLIDCHRTVICFLCCVAVCQFLIKSVWGQCILFVLDCITSLVLYGTCIVYCATAVTARLLGATCHFVCAVITARLMICHHVIHFIISSILLFLPVMQVVHCSQFFYLNGSLKLPVCFCSVTIAISLYMAPTLCYNVIFIMTYWDACM